MPEAARSYAKYSNASVKTNGSALVGEKVMLKQRREATLDV